MMPRFVSLSQLCRAAQQLVSDQRGVQMIEFVGYFPLVLLTLAVAWQFLAVGYTGLLAANAAREGARAAATRENVDRAVAWASPGYDGRRTWQALAGYPCAVSSQPVTIEVRLEVPHVLVPFVGALGWYPAVTQQATARCEPPPITRTPSLSRGDQHG